MATIDGIGLQEPSTITKSLAAVAIERNSSMTYQEVMVLGSPNSTTSSALAEVTNAAAASTAWGLVTRTRTNPESTSWASSAGFHFDSSGALQVSLIGTTSTGVTVNRTVGNSSAADYMPARLVDSSGTGFHGLTNPLPTQLLTSSGASAMDSTEGAVKVNVVAGAAGGSTQMTVRQSTAGDLLATITFGSTGNTVLSRLTTSSGGNIEGSSGTPPTGALGVFVRPAHPTLTIVNSTAGTDTIATLVSSQATSKPFVCAYTVNSTEAGPVQCGFYSGATLVWPVTLWAGGGVVKDAQAVPHPSYLFAGSTGAGLTFNVASTGAYRVAITYWTGA